MQLLNCHDADVSTESYLHVIHCKTAKLFEAAMRLGAILCHSNSTIEHSVAEYGRRLGTAFQLIDDVLDYSGDEQTTGKNLGDDLAEGKPTLPLIYAIQNGNISQKNIVKMAIEQGDITLFTEVLQVVKQTGALSYTREQAQIEADAACAAIAILPDTDHKSTLLQLAAFAANREF